MGAYQINPNIPLDYKPPVIENPINVYGQALKLRGEQQSQQLESQLGVEKLAQARIGTQQARESQQQDQFMRDYYARQLGFASAADMMSQGGQLPGAQNPAQAQPAQPAQPQPQAPASIPAPTATSTTAPIPAPATAPSNLLNAAGAAPALGTAVHPTPSAGTEPTPTPTPGTAVAPATPPAAPTSHSLAPLAPDGTSVTPQLKPLDPQAQAQIMAVMGTRGPAYIKANADIQEQLAKVSETQAKLDVAHADLGGRIGALVKSEGYDPNELARQVQFQMQQNPGFRASGMQVLQRIQQDPSPQNIKRIVDGMIQFSPEQRKLGAEEAQAAARQQQATTTQKKNELEAPDLTAKSEQAQVAGIASKWANTITSKEDYGAARAGLPDNLKSYFPAQAPIDADGSIDKQALNNLGLTAEQRAQLSKTPKLASTDRAIDIYAKPPADRTPEENAYIAGFEKLQKVTKTDPGVDRILAMASTREYPVMNTETGQLEYRSARDINSTPGTFAPAGAAASAMSRGAIFKDLHFNIDTARKAISDLPAMDAQTNAQLSFALRSTDPHSAVSSFLAGAAGKALTPQQSEAVQSLALLQENAMALRSVAGLGQGSDELRAAILNTIPSGKSPSKDYAQQQLNKFEAVVSRLETGVPHVGKLNAPPPATPTATTTTTTPGVVPGIALKDGTTLHPHTQAAADQFRKDHPELIK